MKKLQSILLIAFLSAGGLFADNDTDDHWEKISESGKIRIGISTGYPVLNNAGKENSGVEIELAREFASYLGKEVELIPLSLSEILSALESGKIDIAFAGLSRDLERGKTIWFSQPYLEITPAALINRKFLPKTSFGENFELKPFKTVWDIERLTGLELAVKKSSVYEGLIKRNFPAVKPVLYSENEEGVTLLKKGKVQGIFHDSLYLQYLYDHDGRLQARYELLQGGDQKEYICAGMPKGELILEHEVNFFLSEMQRSGKIYDWTQKYLKR